MTVYLDAKYIGMLPDHCGDIRITEYGGIPLIFTDIGTYRFSLDDEAHICLERILIQPETRK